MARYSERMKSLDGTRMLMRDFLVYGYHTRTDYDRRSARTYDNERRRVEGLLGDALKWEYSRKGKRLFVSVDASELADNPLNGLYRLKSFTDNDIILHFLLMDALADGGGTLEQLTDRACETAGRLFDIQIVRRKLEKLESAGLATAHREGRRFQYSASGVALGQLFPDQSNVAAMLSFFREAAPFGVVADYIMRREGWENRFVRFKHHFLLHTLDDAELLKIVACIRNGSAVKLRHKALDGGFLRVYPVRIRESTQTGRRYLIGWDLDARRTISVRVDRIYGTEPLQPPPDADALREVVHDRISEVWGVSLREGETLERLRMTLRIDEATERFVLARLEREGRGGTITRERANTYRYEIATSDAFEMLGWVKTFTGRIVDFACDNKEVERRFISDMRLMAEMYGGEEK